MIPLSIVIARSNLVPRQVTNTGELRDVLTASSSILNQDFDLEYVANGNGSFKLSDHLGDEIVIAFFAPN